MSETTDATPAQGADDAKPQGGTAPAQGADAQQAHGASADQGGTGDVADLARKLAEFERDNARYRRRIAELERADQARQQEGLTELEKAQQRIAELERDAQASQARIQGRLLNVAAQAAAIRIGFRSPDIASRLIDPAEVEWTEAGDPKNLDKLLKAVAERAPELVKQPVDLGGGPRGKTPDGAPSMNELIRAATRGS